MGKKDNVDRGLLNGGSALDDDNTVRAMAMVIDLNSNSELIDQRIDFDNAGTDDLPNILNDVARRYNPLQSSYSCDCLLYNVAASYPDSC